MGHPKIKWGTHNLGQNCIYRQKTKTKELTFYRESRSESGRQRMSDTNRGALPCSNPSFEIVVVLRDFSLSLSLSLSLSFFLII